MCAYGEERVQRGTALYHINFHTFRAKPVFELEVYESTMRRCLAAVLKEHHILCLAWEVMPTHVHMIVVTFPDFPRSTVVKRVKGATAHAFLAEHPELREDLGGGHLWTKGHFAVEITSHEQLLATLHYVRNNRAQAGLAPPLAPQSMPE
jgi:putative transposase